MLVSLGVNSPVLGDHLTSWDRKPEGPNKSAHFAWTLVSWHSRIFEYRVWHLLRSCGHRRGYIYGSLVISSRVSSISGSGYYILSILLWVLISSWSTSGSTARGTYFDKIIRTIIGKVSNIYS